MVLTVSFYQKRKKCLSTKKIRNLTLTIACKKEDNKTIILSGVSKNEHSKLRRFSFSSIVSSSNKFTSKKQKVFKN